MCFKYLMGDIGTHFGDRASVLFDNGMVIIAIKERVIGGTATGRCFHRFQRGVLQNKNYTVFRFVFHRLQINYRRYRLLMAKMIRIQTYICVDK